VNGELFFSNYFSIGLDAAIVRDFDRARAARWARLFPPRRLTNNLLYLLMGIKNAGFHLEPEITIDYRADTENHRTKLSSRCRTIIVTNLPVYAGGCRIRSEALIDDGLFEVTVVSTLGQYVKIILTRFLPFLEPSRRMSRFTAENAVIRLKTISPCQKDGERCSEPAAATETYEIMFHSPIRVLAPAPPYGETGPA
jgi:diacylglycerol kinase family enzyme